jgi:hypothetical protein
MPARVVLRRDWVHYVLVVRRGEVLPGCSTMAMKIEQQADGTIAAQWMNGIPVKWTKR